MDNTTSSEKQFISFEGKMLVASPHLGDQMFERSVVYICVHDMSGAIGVIINHRIGNIAEKDLVEYTKANKHRANSKRRFPVLFGGPACNDKIIVLSLNKEQEKMFNQQHSLTLYTDINLFLQEYAAGRINSKLLFARGIATWTANQLEWELAENSWLLMQASVDLLFSQRLKHKWDFAMRELGISKPHNMVYYSGEA